MFVGRLEQVDLAALLTQLEQSQKTGLLIIQEGQPEESRLYFEHGELIHVHAQQESAPLLSRLLEVGVLSETALQDRLQKQGMSLQTFSTLSEQAIAEFLISTKLMKHSQLLAWAREEARIIIHNLLSLSIGTVTFNEGVQVPFGQVRLELRPTLCLPSRSLIKPPQPLPDESDLLFMPFPALTPPISLPVKNNTEETTTTASLDVTDIQTLVRQPIIPASIANILYPAPCDDLTTPLPASPGKQHKLLRWEIVVICVILAITGLAHGMNMFHYPYFEDDEGTYISQAWAIVNEGQLAPYTYWYDHAPVGWIQIAAWSLVTGGFHTFGPAIDSGRVLMLLYQLASTFLLYQITRRLTPHIPIAVLVCLLFALSPFGIFFHRRVLLDNITTFWMLLSLLLLLSRRLTLTKIWLSAIALALSILSKELTVFLIPVMAYLVFYRADSTNRTIAIIGWLGLVLVLVSLYVLMALLKGEFFPTGTLLGGTAQHVSLVNSLLFQSSRDKDGGLFDPNSGFWPWVKIWSTEDALLVVGGLFSMICCLFAIKKQRLTGIMGLLTLSLWLFLGRGGTVLQFYLVPLLPLLALNLGLTLVLLSKGLACILDF